MNKTKNMIAILNVQMIYWNLKQIKDSYPANRAKVEVNQNIDNFIKECNLEIENEVDNNYVLKLDNEEKAHNLLKILVQNNVVVNRFEIMKPTLNDIFVEKVGEE